LANHLNSFYLVITAIVIGQTHSPTTFAIFSPVVFPPPPTISTSSFFTPPFSSFLLGFSPTANVALICSANHSVHMTGGGGGFWKGGGGTLGQWAWPDQSVHQLLGIACVLQ